MKTKVCAGFVAVGRWLVTVAATLVLIQSATSTAYGDAVLLNPIEYIQPPLGEQIGMVVIEESLNEAGGPPSSATEVAWGTVDLDFSNAGLTNKWWVWKSVTNNTMREWRDFHITIIVDGQPSPGSPSPQKDGISFGELFGEPAHLGDPEPVASVDPDWPLDNPFADGWTGTIVNEPYDEIWYEGAPAVQPGETIHFVFPLSGTTFVPRFQLEQHATVPEPGGIALALLGGLAMVGLIRRRSQR